MKVFRWLAVLGLVIAVIATGLYLRRDYLAQNIANSVLGEQDLVVTELSVDAMTPSRLELSQLVVESASGARYAVTGLSVPLGASGARLDQIRADSLTVTYDSERATRSLLSTTLQKILDLPMSQPNLSATIERVALPGLPELRRVSWATAQDGQQLFYTVGSIAVVVRAVDRDNRRHHVSITGTGVDGEEVVSADILLSRHDELFNAVGEAMIDTGAWLPILQPLNLLPDGLVDIDAGLRGPIEIRFDHEAAGAVSIDTQLALVDAMSAAYATPGGQLTEVHVAAVEQLSVDFKYPTLAWLARAEIVDLTVTADDVEDLPFLLSDLECRQGIRCTTNALVETRAFEWNAYTFDTLKLTLPLEIDISEVTRVDVSPYASGTFTGVRTSDLLIEQISIDSFSGTQLIVADGAWRCRIDNLQLGVQGFTSAGKLIASSPLTLRELDIRDSAQTVDTRLSLAPGAIAEWDGSAFFLPGADGTVSIRNDKLTSTLGLSDSRDALAASLELRRNLATGNGSLAVSDVNVRFDNASLSDFLPDWPYAWDIVRGTWGAELQLEWQSKDSSTQYRGSISNDLQGLSGKFKDNAFVGLNTKLHATLDSSVGVTFSPSVIALRLLDVGLPLEHIGADVSIDFEEQALQVENLSVDALGGKFVADPFQLSTADEASQVMLHARGVQLQLMVDIAEFEDIEMSGAVSGALPMTIEGSKVTIEAGRLESEAPGGVIRYRSNEATIGALVPDSELGLVARALNNFEFDSLTSDVDYTASGDLKLQMRLSGINPDLDPTQPIILNLGIENNVPQLLRSLRAVRSIEDILERRTLN